MLGGLIGFIVGAVLGVATLGKVGALIGAIIGGSIGYLGVVVVRRRDNPRFQTSIAVEILDNPPIYAEATNLSMGGMGLTLSKTLTEGADYEFEFQLVTTGNIDIPPRLLIRGTVMWVVPGVKDKTHDVGVRFKPLTPDQRQLLGRYIEPLIE